MQWNYQYIETNPLCNAQKRKRAIVNVNDLAKQVSSILTPQTDNFYRDIHTYGHFFHNTNDIMWWGDVGMNFLTRAPFDVRWLREERLDDPYGGFLYETTVEDKVLQKAETLLQNLLYTVELYTYRVCSLHIFWFLQSKVLS